MSTPQVLVLDHLSQIHCPILEQDIVSLNWIQNLLVEDGTVSFDLRVLPGLKAHQDLKDQIEASLLGLDWVQELHIQIPHEKNLELTGGLEGVSHIIAVSSCKGGVGKSTTAVNLAYSLKQSGAKVGIFDADIYGPSLPTMLKTDTQAIIENNMIIPISMHNMALMSFGYIQDQNQESGPAMMRGPMVTQVVKQLLTQTRWGELDYLIIDMPPGTGDIHITIAQSIPITAAIIVTTPQKLSVVDVEKGIQMFDALKIPTLGIVENMSYVQNDTNELPIRIFGPGSLERLKRQYGFKAHTEIPLNPAISTAGDSGIPLVLSQPEHHVSRIFAAFTQSFLSTLTELLFQKTPRPNLILSHTNLRLEYSDKDPIELDYKWLRLRCGCAHCVDEFTGTQLVFQSDVSDGIAPKRAFWVGHYALGIEWNNAHQSLYPLSRIIPA